MVAIEHQCSRNHYRGGRRRCKNSGISKPLLRIFGSFSRMGAGTGAVVGFGVAAEVGVDRLAESNLTRGGGRRP